MAFDKFTGHAGTWWGRGEPTSMHTVKSCRLLVELPAGRAEVSFIATRSEHAVGGRSFLKFGSVIDARAHALAPTYQLREEHHELAWCDCPRGHNGLGLGDWRSPSA
jgi:hypothetical protein